MGNQWVLIKDQPPPLKKKFLGWNGKSWLLFAGDPNKEVINRFIKVYKLTHWLIPEVPSGEEEEGKAT